MCTNPAAANRGYTLTYLGKKVGRNHAVAPAGKQLAWETTSPTSEEPCASTMPVRVNAPAPAAEELPGRVPEWAEAGPSPKAYTRQAERRDHRQAGTRSRSVWMKRWAALRRWFSGSRRKRPRQQFIQGADVDLKVLCKVGPVFGVARSDHTVVHSERQDNMIYIPFESAEICVTEIAQDIDSIKKKHMEIVKELERNFKMTARESQQSTSYRIRAHYQHKLKTLKRMLSLYQEKVDEKNTDLEKRVEALSAQNKQLLEERSAERRRSKEEASLWQREKSKMMEMFSQRLDVLHNHQASTLQELQMARQEVGKVQEMLLQTAQTQEATGAESSENNETCKEATSPLEGAKRGLDELDQSLSKREREITELLESQSPVPPVPLPPCTVLLSKVIQKAHAICRVTEESRALLSKMIEENKVALKEAQDKLGQLDMSKDTGGPEEFTDKGSEEYESELSSLQENLTQLEVTRLALFCIRTGQAPAMSECDVVSELEDVLGKGTVQAMEGVKSFAEKFVMLQDEMKMAKEERKKIVENYTSERTLRKKYYNMVEDLKGKIRVFCRIRPVNRAEVAQGGAVVVAKIDDFSVNVETPRGPREFQFDQVLSTEATQEDMFQDARRLIQSAIDGYNVCIFAYGQTGSGKTYTMVGDKEKKNPGIMPRSFNAIFDIIDENSSKFHFKVSAYMLELYNDRLMDLFVGPGGEGQALGKRVEIKRNRKGVVFAQGAETKEATSAQQLYALFQQACTNRHIAATKMNVESSRSHLIVGIKIENKNLTNGSVSTGKLSLVDLAGSERAAKTGAKDHKLKEANSINKSLSALGDVISALSSELPHVPYRNSKLTQIMQDSLGGNAKTLMIVNISPSEYNLDETLTSLIYATRVKAITNNAQRFVDSKEIAHLKEIITKLKAGQAVEEEDI